MKKTKYVDRVRVKTPCSERWEEMIGNDQVRFCSHCAKHVNDISKLTRKEATRLVRASGGSLCIRYISDPRTQVTLFKNDLVRIARRASRMTVGVMSASLSLAAMSYAQDGSPVQPVVTSLPVAESTQPRSGEREKQERPTPGGVSNISGTIQDPQGAVIPGATVTLLDDKGNALQSRTTNDEGKYSFENIDTGSYSISAEAQYFRKFETQVSVTSGSSQTIDATLDIGAVMLSGVVAIEPEFKGELAKAVSNDDVDEARNLIAAGADLNGREDDRTTPLFIAVENGNLEMVRLLLDFGAKVNAKNEEKETPLMKLDEDASKDLVEALIAAGAKVNAVSKSGDTALILAARNAKAEVIQALIYAGADLDAKNENGETALMNAADADNFEAVKILVLAGANVNLKNNDGDTAWDKTSDDEIEDFLVGHGAIVEEKPELPDQQSDDGGDSPPWLRAPAL